MEPIRKFLIRNEESGLYLKGLSLQNTSWVIGPQIRWTDKIPYAIFFDCHEEAQATLDFIRDVLDFELAEQLAFCPVPLGVKRYGAK